MMALLLVGTGLILYTGSTTTPDYITAPIERGVIATEVKATGRVEAVSTVDVSSQLSGQIAKVLVGFNDRVTAGQPIAALDANIFAAKVNEAAAAVKVAKADVQVQQAQVARAGLAVLKAQTDRQMAQHQAEGARARQTEAEQDFQRKLELTRGGSVSEREVGKARAARDTAAAEALAALDQITIKQQAIAMLEAEARVADANAANAEAAVEQRQATLDQARLDLERTVVRAPIDGIVIKRDVNPGQTVAVSLEAKTLFTIAHDLHEMEVQGKIDEADIGRIAVGQKVLFTVDAYPDRGFAGSVLQVRAAPDSKEGVVTYTALISAQNPDLLLLPGMTATLRITVDHSTEVLAVPPEALRFQPTGEDARGGSSTVWVMAADGRPQPVPVMIGVSDDHRTEVRSTALSEGQPVIVGGSDAPPRRGFFGLRLGF